jgi:hypothetical protein
MRWPRPYPTRGDVMGILFIVVLLGLISSSFFYWFPNSKPINYGFGPDWDCTLVPNGQPICIKKPGQ